jgi:PAS domain S-box-containing protein
MKKTFFIISINISFYLYFSLFISNTAYSQAKNEVFERITVKNGLSQSTVNYIIQDKKGFMWFATYGGGINRYDGYSFKVYRHNDNDKNSLSNNETTFLFEDRDGYIWVLNSVHEGLDKFDPVNESFTNYENDPNDSTSISSNEVNDVMQDKSGNIWICTKNALNLVVNEKRGDKTITKFKRFYNVSAISFFKTYEDRNGRLLLFADYLYYLDRKTYKIYRTIQLPDTLAVQNISEDKSGNLWLGTNATGIIKLIYNKQTQNYEYSEVEKINVTPNGKNYIIIDNKDRIWIGTRNKGLFLYDTKENRLENFLNDKTDVTSISDNTIFSLFIDRSGVLWIGTYSQGLCKLDLYKKDFLHFKSIPGNKNTLSANIISSIHSTVPRELWVGSDVDGGVNRFIFDHDKVRQVIHYKHDPDNKNSIAGNSIICLVQRKNGEVWAGSADGYVSKIIPEKAGNSSHPIIKTYNTPAWTFCIYEDRQGTVWGGTWGGGLWKYDDKTDKLIFYTHDPSNPLSLCDVVIWSIYEDNSGNIWIGGHGEGLSILPEKGKNKSTPQFINFKYEKEKANGLSNNTINVFYQDQAGTMWIGTNGGLNKAIIKDNNFREINSDTKIIFFAYHMKDGLPAESISGILEDNHGKLWLSTGTGLSKFNIKENSFTNYDESDGLQGNEFGHNSYFKDQNGRMYFGGHNGFNAFYPDDIKLNVFLPNVVFTDLKLFNKSVGIGEKINGDIIISKSLNNISEIMLSHANNIFTLEFSALHYTQPEKNQYVFKLEGFEKDWNYVGTKHSATYTNLDPGEYIFRVKGSNNDGVWNEEGISLTIVITPPFWGTIWFRLIMLAVIAGIVFWIYRGRVQARKLAAEKQIEAAVTKERNLLRTLIDNIPDGIYVKDIECRKVIVNPADIHHLGRTSEAEVLGKNDFDIYPKELAEGFFADDQSVIKTGQPVINREEYILDENGQKLWLDTSKLPLWDEKGQIIGLVGVGRDITEKKKAAEERKKAEKERERLIIELQDALADVKLLSGLVPICANCKKIRDDQGYWTQIESYIQDRSDAKFSHSICPDCAAKLYPNYNIKKITDK